MRIESAAAKIATEAAQSPQAVQQSIQVATLKRALEGQKQEASDLLKLLEPKGRVLDIYA